MSLTKIGNNKRLHIVISNYQKLSSFVDNFGRIKGFDWESDSIYIFDCSSNGKWQHELELSNKLCDHGLVWGKNLFFVRRRNWGVNHGAQLDYFRAILKGMIQAPYLVAFIQEHFLDLKNFVKEDTIPEHCAYDLNAIVEKFESDEQIGCVFHSRYGVRVIISNPVVDSRKEFFGDSDVLLDRATRRGFTIDGGNFIVRPDLYIKWFATHPSYLTVGDGSYGFSHVWEARLGQILYNQKIKWCDLSRNLEYTSISELDALEKTISNKISKLWYDNRVWYFYYGRDQWKYPPLPLKSVLQYLPHFKVQWMSFPRNTQLIFCQPKDFVNL